MVMVVRLRRDVQVLKSLPRILRRQCGIKVCGPATVFEVARLPQAPILAAIRRSSADAHLQLYGRHGVYFVVRCVVKDPDIVTGDVDPEHLPSGCVWECK
jgi:hypothetical protein